MLMKSVSVLAVASLLGQSWADGTSSTTTQAATTTSSAVATHTISVGAEGFNFIPNAINASVGSIIEYRFYPQNHSVARAAYGQPCIPYENTGAGPGFYSGFFPIEIVTNDLPKFQVRINDTDPVFFYCSAPNACFQGMVGVINPNSTETFESQFLFSQNATQEFSPGENPFPVEALPTRTTTATGPFQTVTAAPSTTVINPLATTTPSQSTTAASAKHGLGAGPIAGISIAGFAALVLAAALVYMCGRQRTMTEILNRHSDSTHKTYRPASTGISEVLYPNTAKNQNAMTVVANPYGPSSYTETDGSYRSASPPIDERTGMNPMAWGPGAHPTTSVSGPGSPRSGTDGFLSPMYEDGLQTHSISTSNSYGAPSYGHTPASHPTQQSPQIGPHELPAPSPNGAFSPPSDLNSARPFSYTNSESGYATVRDDKIDEPIT